MKPAFGTKGPLDWAAEPSPAHEKSGFTGSAWENAIVQLAGAGDARFIGIEREPKYFDVACRRIEDAQRMQDMFAHEVRDAHEMTAQQADLLEGAK